MAISEIDVEKGALLHDLGKVFQRAGGPRKTHSVIGAEVLRPFFSDPNDPILHAVAYHHQDELKKANTPADDLSYLVYEADNLAAASDRRDLIAETAKGGFSSKEPLHNVFNIFSGQGTTQNTAYPLRNFGENEKMYYPENLEQVQASTSLYKQVVEKIRASFSFCSPKEMTVAELLQILAATTSYIPSSTNKREVPDISLYDHVKLTAAYAVCLWHHFQEVRTTNYKLWCYGSKREQLRQARVYLLVSGDISGIQKFIYTIPSKGALKSLRGRSLYLDVLLEHIADELLEACHVSRSCLLYTGGGHFYMLLPNTLAVKEILSEFQTRLNDWFLRHYGNHLYMALAYVPCSAKEFMKDGAGAGQVFHQVSQKLGQEKLCRYDETQLQKMFNPKSSYNVLIDAERECAICHSSTAHLQSYGEETSGDEACDTCNALFRLGKNSLENDIFYISTTKHPDAVPLPGFSQDLYLRVVSEAELSSLPEAVRLYTKNRLMLGKQVAATLWMGDYTYRNEQGQPLEFAELARQSGGSNTETGIERLGILRADVDNLGAAFIAGFSMPDDRHDTYDTLSRKAVLSRSLSIFFKRYINDLCQGDTADGRPGYTLFAEEQKKERQVHIIYSGGDDMFLAGTWDDIIEVAIDLRHAFQKFTNGKLTFSAGIGFFKPSFPIAQMAKKTGELEDYAKDTPGKNSVALFGEVVEYGSYSENQLTARYNWDDFEKGVCQEKLRFLEENFVPVSTAGSHKLTAGKGLLYRFLSLLREAERKPINIARFAYVLARLEPDKKETQKQICYERVRRTFYDWYQSAKDRQQLITAIELWVYHKRDKEGMGQL